jgi:hypothetical protein
MPSRLAILALVGLLCLAGCTGAPGTQPTDTTHSTPTTAATPTAEPVTFPEGPKSKPERPDELSNASVRQYVYEMESRAVYNSLWRGNYSQVTVRCEVEEVTQHDDRYEAVVVCTGFNNVRPPENSTATPGPHYDYFTQAFRYYVTDEMTRKTFLGER